MPGKESEFAPKVDFGNLNPQMLIGDDEDGEKIEKAFLSSPEDAENEYKRITASWD